MENENTVSIAIIGVYVNVCEQLPNIFTII